MAKRTGSLGKGKRVDVDLMKLLSATSARKLNGGLLLLRWTVGVTLFVAGAGKVFGWFGGGGLTATIDIFVTKLGIPAPLAYLSCYTELVGGLLLILGLLTRPAAFAVTINMLVATIVTAPAGFFAPGGAAYPFSLMMISLVILLAGPLAYSLDAWLAERYRRSAGILGP